MASGFGFTRPAGPAPDPRQVGAALVQGGSQAPAAQPVFPSVGSADAAMGDQSATMRHVGGIMMGGAGQTQITSAPDDQSAAINTAVGEYLTRQGGGYVTNRDPSKPRAEAKRQLMHLGLSETEADLMILGGGA